MFEYVEEIKDTLITVVDDGKVIAVIRGDDLTNPHLVDWPFDKIIKGYDLRSHELRQIADKLDELNGNLK